jgi:hypothetical protein
MEDTDGARHGWGSTYSSNDISGENIYRGLIVKTNPDGEIIWQYSIGGDEYDRVHFSSGVVMPDGGYIWSVLPFAAVGNIRTCCG